MLNMVRAKITVACDGHAIDVVLAFQLVKLQCRQVNPRSLVKRRFQLFTAQVKLSGVNIGLFALAGSCFSTENQLGELVRSRGNRLRVEQYPAVLIQIRKNCVKGRVVERQEVFTTGGDQPIAKFFKNCFTLSAWYFQIIAALFKTTREGFQVFPSKNHLARWRQLQLNQVSLQRALTGRIKTTNIL